MRRDRIENERILENGSRILNERPELADMSLSDILDELDGSSQMISDRWGVTAHVVCRGISQWDNKSLIQYLSKVEGLDLTCEYVGFLLQTKYGISLEELIIEADQVGAFDVIVRFISQNLKFLPSVCGKTVCRVLTILEKYTERNTYSSFVNNYAIGIASCDGYLMVMNELGDLSSVAQYHLVSNLRRHWFKKDANEASNAIQHLLGNKSVWSKKSAIEYWEMAIQYDASLFQKHLIEMECLCRESEEYWCQMIPAYVAYVNQASQETRLTSEYGCALTRLRELPSESDEIKCCFFRSIQFYDGLSNDLWGVYREIIAVSFHQNCQALDCLDYFWDTQINHGNYENVIQDMAVCFRTNKFRTHYSRFFEILDATRSALAKHSTEVTELALKYILKNNADEIFFGLGLLSNTGNIAKFHTKKSTECVTFSGLLLDEQMIQVMKPILYFSVDDQQICHFAFQILSLAKGMSDAYMEFCMSEVYGNYPVTLYEVSAHYRESDIKQQSELAKKVNDAYELAEEEYKIATAIKDLMPCWEHQRIYHKAQNEHSKQIRKMANEKSVFANLFRSQSLKYGVRSGFIVRGAKKEKYYQVAPFQRFEKKMELAANYVNNPVDYEMRRRSYLCEVTPDETDN